MKIYKLETLKPNVIEAFKRLIPQLSEDCNVPSEKDLEDIINSECTNLFVAEENNEIIGTLSLVFNKIPTGKKAWIEDVVVDKTVRGKGVGKELILFAMKYAKEVNHTTINLTSSPEREAANKLYQKLGFLKRETNVYRTHLH
ncbi:GNAT family N-acetyltransferase [Polaribacter ponticola]|uniref:GNAT family N-acetyltransferase n=1 Tax=Polaribacter ponticola TaxID=2978475 RepID=A0ABT5SB32_9FLAO|nr:GNAT family N-acetyltransferase [Polaribacter sp. MSW5]MDD7915322.1 GNAT family N-acetyltransferase [Polaribacter sp. MSW5]